MRDHEAPACTVRILGCLNCFSDGADLINLEQQSIARFEVNGLLDKLRVRNGDIITEEYCQWCC